MKETNHHNKYLKEMRASGEGRAGDLECGYVALLNLQYQLSILSPEPTHELPLKLYIQTWEDYDDNIIYEKGISIEFGP